MPNIIMILEKYISPYNVIYAEYTVYMSGSRYIGQ